MRRLWRWLREIPANESLDADGHLAVGVLATIRCAHGLEQMVEPGRQAGHGRRRRGDSHRAPPEDAGRTGVRLTANVDKCSRCIRKLLTSRPDVTPRWSGREQGAGSDARRSGRSVPLRNLTDELFKHLARLWRWLPHRGWLVLLCRTGLLVRVHWLWLQEAGQFLQRHAAPNRTLLERMFC